MKLKYLINKHANQKNFLRAFVTLIILGLIAVGVIGNFVFTKKSPITSPIVKLFASNIESETIGILSVVTDCAIPEGCGPKYKLWDSEIKTSIPLLGNIKDKDSGLIVRVDGSKITLPRSEYGDMNYRGVTEAIKVSSYTVLSKISYHNFLVDKADEHTLQNYPCLARKEYGRIFTKYNKTFGWEFNNNTPIIKVRMTNTLSDERPEAFYELWYNGNSGDFIKEISEPKDKVFCQ
jgi:hypothetical protein